MVHIDCMSKVLKRYPYRTAFVRNVLIEFDRTVDSIATFETRLAKAVNASPDNHTAYQCQTANGTVFYIGCSDAKYFIGLTIDEENW